MLESSLPFAAHPLSAKAIRGPDHLIFHTSQLRKESSSVILTNIHYY